MLLSAARICEVTQAKISEKKNGIWIIPENRTKNSRSHRIALGPWGRSLMVSNHEWVFKSDRDDAPLENTFWYRARDRILANMRKISGKKVEHFTPHDLRRTARSNTKRLNVDYETAESMLNHTKKGLEKTYDLYELEEEKRAWFLKWEEEIISIAKVAGVAAALGAPTPNAINGYSINITSRGIVNKNKFVKLIDENYKTSIEKTEVKTNFLFTWTPK